MIRDLLSFEPVGRGTDIGGTLDYLSQTLREHAIVFVVSDFIAPDVDRALKILAQRHDVVAITVDDPSERELPDIGIARLTDPETGETVDVDTSSPRVREMYAQQVAEERESRRKLLRRLGIDEVAVKTDGNYIEPLLRFFRARETQARRR